MESLDEIWAGDLFNRRKEAEDLAGYLVSVAGRPAIREDGHAHVLAVDTEYGYGKTYFLRRLARHMRQTHAVAFVDAWVDDLQDEPMVALAATLEEALKPWVDESKPLQNSLANFKAKTGRVAKIVGAGLAKRAVGFIITQSAADAIGEIINKADEVDKDIRKDSLKDAGNAIFSDAERALGSQQSNMEKRIAQFREGKAAIKDMKAELENIVSILSETGMQLPITIVVDELDRCRPTYAIKVLEEIKHLFDVPGVAFILGMHGQQLAHSVSAAYGASFDGAAYLRRFFNRRYILKSVTLTPLIKRLCDELAIPANRLQYPQMRQGGTNNHGIAISLQDFIALYMNIYGLSARDSFELMEMLQTCCALTGDSKILLAYLLPLIIGHMRGSEKVLPDARSASNRVFMHYSGGQNGRWMETSVPEMARLLFDASQMTDDALRQSINRGSVNAAVEDVANLRFGNLPADSYARPERYSELLRTVARFS